MPLCRRCGEAILLGEWCSACEQQQQRHHKQARLRERRASYDPHHQINQDEFWHLRRWYPHCPCCGRAWFGIPEPVCQDHIIPLSRGGPNHNGNVQPLCQRCNQWKRDFLIYFDPQQPGYAQPLPERLRQDFVALAHYQPPAQRPPDQLSLGLEMDFDVPRYPQTTPQQLQALTLRHTWERFGLI
ncbi:MAG: HNH endonuclease signature motif containing protein [Synechococcales cyanobacterium]